VTVITGAAYSIAYVDDRGGQIRSCARAAPPIGEICILQVNMAKYRLLLDIETDPHSRPPRTVGWKGFVIGFLASLAAGLVVALLS
jgi:hypothetical protein